MKAFLEIVNMNIYDVVTASNEQEGGSGTGGSKDCEVFEGIPLE